jgi:hypothetical protein
MSERIFSLPDYSMMKNKLKERGGREKIKKNFFIEFFAQLRELKK